jgi:L-methionine (R)-S-oxide reductase
MTIEKRLGIVKKGGISQNILSKFFFNKFIQFSKATNKYFCIKNKTMTFEELKPKVQEILHETTILRDEKLVQICHLLKDHIDYYDWVGFYFRNGDKEELVLGPYVGVPTDHTVIPFGKGICGQVAVSNQNFVVPDVQAQDNYIACSISVKSEIVVPLFVNGKNIGQIDIDSSVIDPFSEADERFLEFVNAEIAKTF